MAADSEADQFVVVKYPAIAEDDEYLDLDTDLIVQGKDVDDRAEFNVLADVSGDQGIHQRRLRLLRRRGEALHPARYDLQKLNRIKKTIQPRFWSALYQQNPVPDDGIYFTKDQFRRAPAPAKERCNVLIAWDFAISEKKQNDYTVGTVGLQDADDVMHIVDQVRFKSGDAFFIVESILNLSSKWYSPAMVLGFEDGQIYKAIAALLKKRMRERKEYPSISVLVPVTDKMARARPLQGRMQQGMVSFSDTGEWFNTTRAEMLRFPAGVHDDCVDSLAWLACMAVAREAPMQPRGQVPKSWRDRMAEGAAGSSHMTA